MAAPINTYNSATDLSIGHIPQGADDNPELYSELLDIHNALEILLTASDSADAIFAAFIAKFRNITPVSSDYTALATDSLILVDITAGDVTITLPTGEDFAGYRFEVKAIADVLPTTNACLIVGEDTGSGAAPIDEDVGGITIDALEAIPFKYDFLDNKYWINY